MEAQVKDTASLRGFDLLDAVIEQITLHPETWKQYTYRCDTGMCVAGWAVELTGGRWASPAGDVDNDAGSDYVLAEHDDHADVVFPTFDGLQVTTADERARRLLCLSEKQAEELFDSINRLPDILHFAERFKAEAAAPAGGE